MKKIINNISIIIAIIMVTLGLAIDFNSSMNMNGMGKIIIYVTPMLILFLNMIFQIKKAENEEQKAASKKKMLIGIFIIYIIALATLLFLGSTYRIGINWQSDGVQLFSSKHFEYFSNLIPFRTITTYIQRLMNHTINTSIVFTNILGNLIAFAPMGFFIPILFGDKIKNVKSFTALVVISVLIAEIIQFVTLTGQLDVDDIILNTFGAVIVYGLMKTKLVKNILEKLLK